jgi:DUF2971 family protein
VPGRQPTHLYKYVPPARLDILVHARVRFTPPAALNDPFEMRPTLERAVYASDVDEHGLHTEQAFGRHMEEAFARDRRKAEEIRGRIGVLSLAADPLNLLMWSHYADEHKGFVLEFDARHPFFHQRRAKDDPFHHVRRVRYQRERPGTQIEAFLDPAVLLTKSLEWKYEREWRMLVDFSKFPFAVADEATGPQVRLVTLPTDCVTGIILGARMPDDIRRVVCAFLAADERYAHVKVCCAAFDPSGFGLVLESPARYFRPEKKPARARSPGSAATRTGRRRASPKRRA